MSSAKGDATRPIGAGAKIIAHIVNDVGVWGAGFVKALSDRWLEPELAYLEWAEGKKPHGELVRGRSQFVRADKAHVVANMCAMSAPGKPDAVDLGALRRCLDRVAYEAKRTLASIHMPRIGTGIGGRTWEEIEPIVCAACTGVDVYVYDLGVGVIHLVRK